MGAGTEETPKTTTEEPEAKPAPAPKPGAKPATELAPKKDPATPSAEAGPKRAKVGGDDDEVPDDAELIELSPSALKKRIARASTTEQKALFARLGVDNADQLEKKVAKWQKLETEAEERARAEMSERERLETDLRKEQGLRAAAEQSVRAARIERVVDKEESRLTRMAERFVDPDYVDVVLPKLAKHLKSEYTDDQLKALKDKDLEKWFKEEIERRPKLARDGGEEPRKVVPLSNGARPADRPSATQTQSGAGSAKTFKPGQANSMSTHEAKAEAAKQGFHW